ncbi:F-box/kelch-repeat protein At3g23880-like [Corylus avellana]|uniref:F-box/kelch-repeat protein At3g23880-like n=1 Tax=Corylus avellana TaxID=13451 RepID=UPI00286CA26F|nr:F-box/kelch-repeat protein At3g23880-like [Corylus avellana]
MLDYLPIEVVFEILIRLPVKSLVSWRCVCKEWCSLISSNAFIAAHTDRSLSRSDDNNKNFFRYGQSACIGLRQPKQFQHFSLRSDDGSFGHNSNFIDLNFPFKTDICLDVLANIVGSWNGLFCFAYDDPNCGNGYSLWNPSINRALRLPEPNFTFSSHSQYMLKHSHGFGYDPSTNDVKLVRLVYREEHRNKIQTLVEIYTLNAGCWRPIDAPAPSYIVNERCLSVFVNGASHWIAHTPRDEGTFRNVIVAFDMGDEVFREIAVPNCFVGKLYLSMSVTVRDGLLCLVPFNERETEQSFSIWIMKEYGVGESWTKLFSIPISVRLKRVVAFRKNGELLITDRNGQLLSYEPNIQLATYLGFGMSWHSASGTCFTESWFYWDKYMESLILLNANTSDSSARKFRRKGNNHEDNEKEG